MAHDLRHVVLHGIFKVSRRVDRLGNVSHPFVVCLCGKEFEGDRNIPGSELKEFRKHTLGSV